MRSLVIILSIALVLLLGVVAYVTLGTPNRERAPVWSVPGGEPEQGSRAIVLYGCFSCHVVPGVRTGAGRVGPKLEEIGRQIYIGGVLTNTPDNMIHWIQDPRRFSPETAMPDLEVTEQDARNISAYLFQNS